MTTHSEPLRMPRGNIIYSPTAYSSYRALAAFPIAGFSLAVLTDTAFAQTSNLLWLHFSEWLLLAGLIGGVLAALLLSILRLLGRVRLAWPHLIGGMIVLALAVLNSFIHTADGWTAVVPFGLTTSVATVLAMLITGWLGERERAHV